MKKALWGFGIGIGVVAIGLLVLRASDSSVSLLDNDCPESARYLLATTVFKDLRQDDIVVIDGDKRVKRLTKDGASAEPTFSPDGQQIAFTNGRGRWEECCDYPRHVIEVMNVDGTNRRDLTDGRHSDHEPAWSPKGDLIAFVRSEVGLMVVPSDGGEARLVVRDDGSSPMHSFPRSPTWSSDGSTIAFAAGVEDGAGGLYTIDIDTSDTQQIAAHLGVGQFDWSPDGHTFAYDGGEGIFTVTKDEPNPRLWLDDAEGPVQFSPDGTALLYVDPDPDRFRWVVRPLEGGEAVPVTRGGFGMGFHQSIDWLRCP